MVQGQIQTTMKLTLICYPWHPWDWLFWLLKDSVIIIGRVIFRETGASLGLRD